LHHVHRWNDSWRNGPWGCWLWLHHGGADCWPAVASPLRRRPVPGRADWALPFL